VSRQQAKRLLEGLAPIASTHAIPDLRGIVPPARIDQSSELLSVSRRAPDRLPHEGVHLPDKPLDLLPAAPAREHVGHDLRDDSPLFPRLQLGPCPPGLVALEIESNFQEERDARLLIPAEPWNQWIVRLLQHVVSRRGLATEVSVVR